ncbi:putative ribosomally synthesized peptide with nif11-like leader [Anaerobacterium chartisolvens]|uniref:Putative ribosomally synthesized peptide with nif11-like leader n=1 Tax=Anaerobacterium chartisolvens TaxID=1297424 RepID=A0A369BFL1_9FIRM|nr:Nif11-like leader peptide family natural product precursor [Anaerobacterium chartisolvens]RCX19346.1 putative ribosomally synthesized peptide with nif11-like leader [Anaerobacterium chartisolvens]
MSAKSAKLFIERIKTDVEFAEKVKAFGDAKDRMAFVKEAGFDFTDAELKEVQGELSEDDLDAVAGAGNKCGVIG